MADAISGECREGDGNPRSVSRSPYGQRKIYRLRTLASAAKEKRPERSLNGANITEGHRTMKRQNTNDRKICFAASSGGHFEQLMCLRELMEKYPGFVVTEDASATRGPQYNGLTIYRLEIINRKDPQFLKLLFRNTRRSFAILKKERPDIIISTGVLAVVPLMFMGKFLFGAKIIYIESFAKNKTPTLTGRIVSHIANRMLVQWPGLLSIYPKAVYKGGLY